MIVKKLGEVCDFISGLWTGKKPPYVSVGVIRNTNFHKSGNLDFSDIAQLEVEVKQFSTRQLKFGDIVLEKSGGGPKQPVGRVCVFEKEDGLYSLSNFTSAIRVKNTKELDYKYLHYYLKHLYIAGETEKIQTHSTGIRNLQLSLYKDFLVSLQPLATQKKIVTKLAAIFVEIDKATAAAEANARNAEALFKSYLNRVFEVEGREWSPIKVSKLGKVQSGGTPSSSVREYWGDEIEWYSSGELNDLYTSRSISRVTSEGLKNSNAKVFPENSLLIGMYDTAAMKMSLLSSPAAFNQAIVGIEPSDKFNTIFLYYAFLHIKPYVLSLRRGVRQKNLSLAKIKELEIKLPSIDIQESVCRRLNDFSKTVDFIFSSQFKKISHLNDLKNSILKEAFSAELVKE